MEIVVKQRQTLPDIAIQVYGDVRAVTALAEANSIGVTDDLEPGTTLKCPEIVYDLYLQRYVRALKLQPATAADPDGEIPMKIFTEQFTEEFK